MAGEPEDDTAGKERNGILPSAETSGYRFCFVIGPPRSGTTVLKEMLTSHPAVVAAGEIFNEDNPDSYWSYLKQRVTVDQAILRPSRSVPVFLEYMQHIGRVCQDYKPNAKITIVDVKYDQSHFIYDSWRIDMSALPKIFHLIKEMGWQVIDVHRKNLFALVVSNLIAIRTGIYHSSELTDGRPHAPRVRIEPQDIEIEMAIRASSFERMRDHFAGYPGYLNVLYERMFIDDAGSRFSDDLTSRISQFLGVENQFDCVPRLRKMLVGDIFSYIENAAEIRTRFNPGAGPVKSRRRKRNSRRMTKVGSFAP